VVLGKTRMVVNESLEASLSLTARDSFQVPKRY